MQNEERLSWMNVISENWLKNLRYHTVRITINEYQRNTRWQMNNDFVLELNYSIRISLSAVSNKFQKGCIKDK